MMLIFAGFKAATDLSMLSLMLEAEWEPGAKDWTFVSTWAHSAMSVWPRSSSLVPEP